jgi:hypothetical protein
MRNGMVEPNLRHSYAGTDSAATDLRLTTDDKSGRALQHGHTRWRSYCGALRLRGGCCGKDAVSLKVALWAVVIAMAVYGIVLHARGDFA